MRPFRSLLLSILALWRGLSQKEIGARMGMESKLVSYHLRKGELDDPFYERLLAALRGSPAEIAVVTACLEGLEALDRDDGQTAEERAEIEVGVLEGSRLIRNALTEAVRQSRALPPLDVYPSPEHLEPMRWLAGEQWASLKDLPEDQQLVVVQVARDFQHWALVERVCEESVVQASRKLERAAFLARMGVEIAEKVRGPEGWRNRVRGYAGAHGPNVLRVAGEFKAAEAGLGNAKRLWEAGDDPQKVLDPGRLLNLEGALRRELRQFNESLRLLDIAAAVGRHPELALIQKGLTLEVMGEYERAVETLLQAEPLLDHDLDPRLWSKQNFNLAVNFCHLGRYAEAASVAQKIRDAATNLGDEIFLIRVIWLDGRIAAGCGRAAQALSLLEQARLAFSTRKMWYDTSLALLEMAALMLKEGRTTEVRALASHLVEVFNFKGVHREALAALQLFYQAVECEQATDEFALRILNYLFRARHDQGLRFTCS
jgi:tetratricopeptide (TPR) repeat protein